MSTLVFLDSRGRVERIFYDHSGLSDTDKVGSMTFPSLPPLDIVIPKGHVPYLCINMESKELCWMTEERITESPAQPAPQDPTEPPVESPLLEKRVDVLEKSNTDIMMALTEVHETAMGASDETFNTMLALSETYEIMLDIQNKVQILDDRLK